VSFPVSQITSIGAEDGVATTEEFAPDAAQELAEEERNGQLVPGRTSTLVRRKKKKQSGPIAKTAPLVIITTVLGALGAWYRQEKVNVGYCGVGVPNWSLASNEHIPAWVHDNFQPSCEPCPQHAVCYPNMEVECENDFVLKSHPLSLNGAVPLPPTCEPDSEKQRRIKAVADRAIEELRERRASYECGEDITTPSNSIAQETEAVKTVAKPTISKLEITEEDLKLTVSKMRRRGMTDEDFEDLWRGALGDVMSRDEVEITNDRYVPADSPVCKHLSASHEPRILIRVDDPIARPLEASMDSHVDFHASYPLWIFGCIFYFCCVLMSLIWIYQTFLI
jgi:hypothetical protein